MTTQMFVYGSCFEGMVHFSKFQPHIVHNEPASILGTAYRLKVGYPVILESGKDSIPGQLLTLKVSDLFLSFLDEFFGFNPQNVEKSLYYRKEAAVFTAGQESSAWVYYLNPSKLSSSAQPIEGGDWQKSMQDMPTLTFSLTERQRIYIQKLGGASGRDIVPINDMSLYRELISLDLIVDKGRRLALSKFGQEVYRYLS